MSKKNPTTDAVPKWAEPWREGFLRPWTVPLPSSEWSEFKKKLLAHGYLSPNFRISEAGSKGGDSCGCAAANPPDLKKAQYHAFSLERVRHKLGDKSMTPLSWYRSPCHNSCVGGASQSHHLNGWATDWSDSERIRLGSDKFNAAMRAIFAHGGIGTASGNVRHVDNGPERRWEY